MPDESMAISRDPPPPDDMKKAPYRLKRYVKGTAHVDSVCAELRSLCLLGYTHVANMPGNFHEIVYYARRFRLIVLDHRVNKMIADLAAENSI